MDIKRFIEDLMANFRTLLLCKIEGCAGLIDLPAEELAECRTWRQPTPGKPCT